VELGVSGQSSGSRPPRPVVGRSGAKPSGRQSPAAVRMALTARCSFVFSECAVRHVTFLSHAAKTDFPKAYSGARREVRFATHFDCLVRRTKRPING